MPRRPLPPAAPPLVSQRHPRTTAAQREIDATPQLQCRSSHNRQAGARRSKVLRMLLAAALQACALLTSADIAAVQRETPSEKRETVSKRGELDVAQCFYVLPTFARSVSLEVARG